MSDFSDRLRQTRKSRGLSQKTVASLINIATRNYQRYESGETEPSISNLQALSHIFDVSVDYLLLQTNDPTPTVKAIEFVIDDNYGGFGSIDLYGLDLEEIRAVAHLVDLLKRNKAK